MKKIFSILKEILPVIVMVGLIPWIANDYLLGIAYIILIIISFSIKRERSDLPVFIFGLVAITLSEYFFLSTGVETFVRRSLFGVMPLWLPLLWAYGFVVIKRSVKIIDK